MGRRSHTREVPVAVADRVADSPTSSKRKRKRKGEEVVESVPIVVDEDPENAEPRKKKKKKHGKQQPTEQPTVLPNLSETEGGPAAPNAEPSKKTKKKKKKQRYIEQGEGHLTTSTADAQIDPALTALDKGADTGTNAFLNAIVTAASGSSVQGHSQVGDYTHQSSFGNPSFQHLPPGLGGPAVSFSGEDLAQALQSLDVAKLADALQALGEAGSGAFPLPGTAQHAALSALQQPLPRRHGHSEGAVAPQVPTHAGSSSAGSHSRTPVSQTTRNPERARKAPPTGSPHVPGHEDHAHLLANKWLSATKLNELSTTIGLQYRKGKFSAIEEALLKNAIENYRLRNSLSPDQLNEVIFAKGLKDRDNAFWFEITGQVPSRPVVAVYHHVRRSFHPLKQQGKWTPAEDDALREAVANMGQLWEKISQRVGRMAGDCRDRWRNHINNREGRVYGAWSKAEEDQLTQIVTEMTTARGKDPDLDVFWTQVAARMGNRGRQQCRIKWTDCLSKRMKNEGQRPRWSQQDAYILVHKIASMNVNDDSEIDWKLLNDEGWNLWSAHTLQRRWLTLKRGVRGHEEMTHQEIMEILRVKKAHPPPMPIPVKRRVTSAPIVPAEAQASDVAIEDTLPIAGPSGFTGVHGHAFPTAEQPPTHLEPVPVAVAVNPEVEPSTGNAQEDDDDSSSSSSSSGSDSDGSDSD